MSGTSVDGVDVALLETDGRSHVHAPKGCSLTLPYTEAERRAVFKAVERALELDSLAVLDAPETVEAVAIVTARHREAIAQLIERVDAPVDAVGFHGQTILHRPNPERPDKAFTLQIGSAGALADALSLPVIHDFRGADVAAGGQGAPLAPLYHQALLCMRAELPAVILNLGGIANITYVPNAEPEALRAADVGPANVYLDDLVEARLGKPFDAGGALARTGQIDSSQVDAFFDAPFFSEDGPKSLDRYSFPAPKLDHLETTDALATLTQITVQGVARAIQALPNAPRAVFVAGGGVHNTFLMERLDVVLAPTVRSLDTLGASADMMEAEAFAYLAARHLDGLPLSYPSTTGVSAPMLGGTLALPGKG